MGRGLRAILWGVATGFPVFVIIRAIFEAIHTAGYYPDLALAKLFYGAAAMTMQPLFMWGTAAVIAFPFLFISMWGPPLFEKIPPRLWEHWRYIPLRDAAQRAYEKTKDTTIGGLVADLERTPESRLGWILQSMCLKASLYGRRLPSRIMESIPITPESPFIMSSDGTNTGELRGLHRRYVDVSLTRLGLRRHIAYLHHLAKEIDAP